MLSISWVGNIHTAASWNLEVPSEWNITLHWISLPLGEKGPWLPVYALFTSMSQTHLFWSQTIHHSLIKTAHFYVCSTQEHPYSETLYHSKYTLDQQDTCNKGGVAIKFYLPGVHYFTSNNLTSLRGSNMAGGTVGLIRHARYAIVCMTKYAALIRKRIWRQPTVTWPIYDVFILGLKNGIDACRVKGLTDWRIAMIDDGSKTAANSIIFIAVPSLTFRLWQRGSKNALKQEERQHLIIGLLQHMACMQ